MAARPGGRSAPKGDARRPPGRRTENGCISASRSTASSFVAPAVPGRTAGADHVRPDGRGWRRCRARRTFADYVDRHASERGLDSRCPRRPSAFVARLRADIPRRPGCSEASRVFSRDGKSLFYLKSESPGGPTELWRTDVASEKSEKALPGISMLEFDISDDAKEVVYSAQPPGQAFAALGEHPGPAFASSTDRRVGRGVPPISDLMAGSCFRSFDGTNHYLEQMNRMARAARGWSPIRSATCFSCLRTGVGSRRSEPCPMASEAPMRCPSREALRSGSVRAARYVGS